MSDKALKVVPAPEAKTAAEQDAPAKKKSLLERIGRKRMRTFLMFVLPAIVLVAGVIFYLSGGRYVSTDNA